MLAPARRFSIDHRAGGIKRSITGFHARQGTAATTAAAYTAFRLSAATSGDEEQTEENDEGGSDAVGDDSPAGTSKKADAGVLAATATTGAVLGSSVAHSLGLGLDMVGAFAGEPAVTGGGGGQSMGMLGCCVGR